MRNQSKIGYYELETGFEFAPRSYKLDSDIVSTYLKAVEDTSSLYRNTGLVPPMAVAAYAMSALSEGISLPAGTIHVTQELDFLDAVCVGDTITCRAKVTRKQARGKLHFMTIDLDVVNQRQSRVMTGKVGFILPELDADSQQ